MGALFIRQLEAACPGHTGQDHCIARLFATICPICNIPLDANEVLFFFQSVTWFIQISGYSFDVFSRVSDLHISLFHFIVREFVTIIFIHHTACYLLHDGVSLF